MTFLVTAAENTKHLNGGYGLLVVLALAVVVYFLFRSMNKHLRKAARMREDEDAAQTAATRSRSATRKPQRPRR
jgi:uncharacterized protein HemX